MMKYKGLLSISLKEWHPKANLTMVPCEPSGHLRLGIVLFQHQTDGVQFGPFRFVVTGTAF